MSGKIVILFIPTSIEASPLVPKRARKKTLEQVDEFLQSIGIPLQIKDMLNNIGVVIEMIKIKLSE